MTTPSYQACPPAHALGAWVTSGASERGHLSPLGERAYALTWGGAALGWARERDDEARWRRHEQVVVRRGDQVVVSELALEDRASDDPTATGWSTVGEPGGVGRGAGSTG